ncbi:hypothetical protein QK912_10400 [Lactococcus lactis]|jgi:hypothetical protein|uniref:hypothetical protein n=1 Tax=Lactococcus lactis TaxID=1358 RepID=UPI001455E37C|nr:hypothetical protein [Lactococcus lactis]MBR8674945.1 hypothetical protein [Lactococcus lactis subsp. lactis]MBR8677742.1 hypothetical protein [Lactococcus lactis subsp. lactis]MBR8685228.1 hypothetical protein [Lactococcus lactis subsp. lactis]MCH5425746.1 hypothetical protein [Lactococcus lactis]MCH5428386.1 hypothetical protein [Lactococcus lactis]
MNQKELKALKNEIMQEGASNVGYYTTIISKITELWPEIIAEFAKEMMLQGASVATLENPLILNAFVTKAIEKMNYQEFKELAPYFFGYIQTEEEFLAEPIQITRREYLRFQAEGEQLFEYKHPKISFEERVRSLTTMLVPKENQVIAYHPTNDTIAILENSEETPEPFIDPGLINDLTPYPTLVARRLLESSKALEAYYRKEMQKSQSKEEMREEVSEDELLAFVSVKISSTLFELDAQELLTINDILQKETPGKELITHLASGYSQGDRWELAYLKEESSPSERSDIIRYLEHEIGAYYRGSLAWLDIYDSKQQIEERYVVDRETLWNNPLDEVQALTGDPAYLSIEMFEKIKDLNLPADDFNQFILMNNQERSRFLNKHSTQNHHNHTQTQRR